MTALGRIEGLIEDVLVLAKQGKPIDELQCIELKEIGEQSWRVVESDDATLSIEDNMKFRADPERVRQLFENLFRNSIDHGSADAEIRIGQLESGDGYFVEDDGPGIPDYDREAVFQSGYSTTEDGTGLGLSIVSEIADAHGWKIRVTKSELGGARFEFSGVESG